MNNQRNITNIDQASTLRKSNKSSPSTPSPSRRKKIFAEDHRQPISPPRQTQDPKKHELVHQIYKTIQNINWKLQDSHSLQRENQSQKIQNARLRGLIDQNVQNKILKQQKRELEQKIFLFKKRFQKAKILVELMMAGEGKQQKKKELSELYAVFDF